MHTRLRSHKINKKLSNERNVLEYWIYSTEYCRFLYTLFISYNVVTSSQQIHSRKFMKIFLIFFSLIGFIHILSTWRMIFSSMSIFTDTFEEHNNKMSFVVYSIHAMISYKLFSLRHSAYLAKIFFYSYLTTCNLLYNILRWNWKHERATKIASWQKSLFT